MDISNHTEFIKLKDVSIFDNFWSPFMERIRTEVIPYQWEALNDRIPDAEPSFCMRNFKLAAQLTHGDIDYGVPHGTGHGGMVFQDSDLAKWLESAAYSLVWHPDPALEKIIDDAVDIVCNAQQEDGYINTYYIINCMDKRFTNLRDNHELYCYGHFLEAAAAYYEAVGKRKLLDALIRYTDCVDRHIGSEEGKIHGYPGHEIAEMALVRLYNITKDEKHLKLAKYFIDQRGQNPLFFEEEGKKNNNDFYWKDSFFKFQYYQAGKPVREQNVAEGHAVRALYLYSGMADIARLTGDEDLTRTCKNLWNNIVNRQMYITGAIGQSEYGESFSYDYDLPNDTVYGETCASIGLAFFARRMASISPKGSYGDVLDKTLFNSIISGMSLDGKSFFYVNPLEAFPEASLKDRRMKHVKIRRQKWFACACCPPNLARIIASLGSYIHSFGGNNLFTHLYIGSEAKLNLYGTDVSVKIETKYPWEEQVDISFAMNAKAKFKYALRIPGWCKKYSICLNGVDADYSIKDGFAHIDREWTSGDRVTLIFKMPVNFIRSNPHVRENIGKVACLRGPVVYCAEEEDNGPELFRLRIGKPKDIVTKHEKELLENVTTISFTVKREKDWNEDDLYRLNETLNEISTEEKRITLIPYYAWANRKTGEMMVWINE